MSTMDLSTTSYDSASPDLLNTSSSSSSSEDSDSSSTSDKSSPPDESDKGLVMELNSDAEEELEGSIMEFNSSAEEEIAALNSVMEIDCCTLTPLRKDGQSLLSAWADMAGDAPPYVKENTPDSVHCPCCFPQYWYGVDVDVVDGVERVVSVDWSGHNLTGPISPSFSSLTALQALNLSANRLSGLLTPSLSTLRSLATLRLNCNAFTGPVPAWLGSLPLTVLTLHCNSITGACPPPLARLPLAVFTLPRGTTPRVAPVYTPGCRAAPCATRQDLEPYLWCVGARSATLDYLRKVVSVSLLRKYTFGAEPVHPLFLFLGEEEDVRSVVWSFFDPMWCEVGGWGW